MRLHTTSVADQPGAIRAMRLKTAEVKQAITPLRAHGVECQVEIIVRELGRSFLEWCFGGIEPESVESLPGAVRSNDHSFRRLFGMQGMQGDARGHTILGDAKGHTIFCR